MLNDKSAVESFLGDLGQEQNDPFKSPDPFAPADDQVDEIEEEPEVKPVPFHKDPKVMRFIEKEVAKRMPQQASQQQQTSSKDTEDSMTDILTRIIGNDTPEKLSAIKDFRRELSSLEEKGAQRAMQQLQEQAQKQTAEDQQAQAELYEAFEDIEDTFDVDLSSNTQSARKTRSDFMDYVRKIAPKNSNGEVAAFPDLTSAFEEFQARQQRSASRAKGLASRSMSRSSDASVAPAQVDRSWKGVERLFSKLSS